MTTRGVHKPDATLVTSRMLGELRENASTRREFMAILGNPSSRLGETKPGFGRIIGTFGNTGPAPW